MINVWPEGNSDAPLTRAAFAIEFAIEANDRTPVVLGFFFEDGSYNPMLIEASDGDHIVIRPDQSLKKITFISNDSPEESRVAFHYLSAAEMHCIYAMHLDALLESEEIITENEEELSTEQINGEDEGDELPPNYQKEVMAHTSKKDLHTLLEDKPMYDMDEYQVSLNTSTEAPPSSTHMESLEGTTFDFSRE